MKKELRYSYYIVHKVFANNSTGYGSTTVNLYNPLTTLDEIRLIEKELIEMCKVQYNEDVTNVVITNFKLLKGPKPISTYYQKYEFCKSYQCSMLDPDEGCKVPSINCEYGAKEFHEWLKLNNFEIVKKS